MSEFLELSEHTREPNTMICGECQGTMMYKGSGRYECEKCKSEYYTDFGKVKKFLHENGPSNAVVISRSTGVSRSKISRYLKEGRIEIAPGQSDDIQFCLICGVPIRGGKICSRCEQEKANGNKNMKGMYNSAKEKDAKSEMRFPHR